MSLEKAAGQFLQSAGHKKPKHAKVLLEFTCELDGHCRKVLEQTYNAPCNFPDIVALDTKKKFQWCSTHKGMCQVQKHRRGNRISISRFQSQVVLILTPILDYVRTTFPLCF